MPNRIPDEILAALVAEEREERGRNAPGATALALLAIAVMGAVLLYAAAAHADEIETINHRWNAAIRYQTPWAFYAPGGPARDRGDCKAFAGAKFEDLNRRGAAAQIWVVLDERGEQHAVVAVGDRILDQRFSWSESRSELIRYGYVFLRRCQECESQALALAR